MCEWVCAALLRSHSPSPHLNFFSYRLETVKTCVYLFLETIFLRFGPRFYFVTNLWITFARNAKCVWVARKQKQRLSIGRARSMMRSIFDAWRRWESVREQSRRERKIRRRQVRSFVLLLNMAHIHSLSHTHTCTGTHRCMLDWLEVAVWNCTRRRTERREKGPKIAVFCMLDFSLVS